MTVKKQKIRPLTPQQRKVLDFISSFRDKNGFSPSLEEIAKGLNLRSPSGIYQHIELIKAKGHITKWENQSRGYSPLLESENLVQVPLLGKIAAGTPIEAIEDEEPIDVPWNLIKGSGDFYALKVEGDSMIDDDVWDGDVILVKHQNTADIGDMVVAVVDNEATLKRFGGEKDGMIKLIPKNPKLKDIYITSDKNFEIRGKFAGLIRREQSN